MKPPAFPCLGDKHVPKAKTAKAQVMEVNGKDQKYLAHFIFVHKLLLSPSSFPRCIRRSRGNRGQEGRGGGLGTRCPPAAFLWPRWWPGAGLSAPAQAGHHSRPQHPRAPGERRRCPAPRGHVTRARGLELRQRAATERSSAGRSWRVLLLLSPRASCLCCSPLLAARIPSRGAWRRRRRRC